MMFQPRPRLIKAADGSYTLLVAVQVPSFCYRAGTVTPGLPDGGIGIPEIEYFTLEIIHDDDVVCTQLVHDIMFVQTGIRPNSGKYAVGVVAVLDGKPVGSGLVTLPEDGKGKAARRESLPPGVVLLPDSVSAAVFGGFTGITTLHVSASVLTPTSGYKARLVPHNPPGFNPNILLLDLEVEAPTGPVLDVVTPVPAYYLDSPYKGQFTDVTVLAGPVEVTVPIIVLWPLGLRRFKDSEAVKALGGVIGGT
jgi:hypothetical protein